MKNFTIAAAALLACLSATGAHASPMLSTVSIPEIDSAGHPMTSTYVWDDLNADGFIGVGETIYSRKSIWPADRRDDNMNKEYFDVARRLHRGNGICNGPGQVHRTGYNLGETNQRILDDRTICDNGKVIWRYRNFDKCVTSSTLNSCELMTPQQ